MRSGQGCRRVLAGRLQWSQLADVEELAHVIIAGCEQQVGVNWMAVQASHLVARRMHSVLAGHVLAPQIKAIHLHGQHACE
jgi:predicted Fe-S protein YdhL (DUF1289 family)